MSRDNVELVQQVFDVWNRGDLAALRSILGEDWEYRTARKFPGIEAVYRGTDGLTRFWRTFRDPWETQRIEVERMVELRGDVLVLLTLRGKGKESGVEVTTELANLFRFRGGRITAQIGYTDWRSALEAVGLSE